MEGSRRYDSNLLWLTNIVVVVTEEQMEHEDKHSAPKPMPALLITPVVGRRDAERRNRTYPRETANRIMVIR